MFNVKNNESLLVNITSVLSFKGPMRMIWWHLAVNASRLSPTAAVKPEHRSVRHLWAAVKHGRLCGRRPAGYNTPMNIIINILLHGSS